MHGSQMFMISYANLKEMLEEAQMDGLNADGCSCDLHEDAERSIQYEIDHRGITPIPDDTAREIAEQYRKAE